ncbi:hypothetical protein ASJ30_10920 [Janibacter indicus]|uniref:Uncharacterized protein n=1 Tax=Janibacter indicus TaxID=857417 RepID=A0A1L3MIJ0_9MICO|nr:hypothetical protein ASJ30_10920 [Janibacter indicus]
MHDLVLGLSTLAEELALRVPIPVAEELALRASRSDVRRGIRHLGLIRLGLRLRVGLLVGRRLDDIGLDTVRLRVLPRPFLLHACILLDEMVRSPRRLIVSPRGAVWEQGRQPSTRTTDRRPCARLLA